MMKALLLMVTMACICGLTLQAKTKKLIASTFELRNARTSHLARNIKNFERLPFDGVVINSLKLLYNRWPIGGKRRWTLDEYHSEIEDMKTIASGKLKDNFLLTIWTPRKRVPLSDEEGWKTIAHNSGIIAQVAREGMCVGLIMDVEDYNGSNQFYYFPEDANTFEEAAKLARKRGRQVMTAMGEAFPNIKLLVYHLYCAIAREAYSGDLAQTARATRNLWGYFVNGMLEAMPPQGKLIEGNEIGYYMQSNRADFSYMLLDSLKTNRRFVLPENQRRFDKHNEVAIGFYIDSYLMEKGAFVKETLLGSKVKRLRTDLAEAMRLTDEYVWVYGEKYAFHVEEWDRQAQNVIFAGKTTPCKQTYDSLLPRVTEAMALAKNPQAYAEDYVAVHGETLKNLIPNPRCDLNPKHKSVAPPPWIIEGGYLKGPELIPGWYFWPHWDAKPEKRYHDTQNGVDDAFSLVGENLPAGAFVTNRRVKEGECYYLEAQMQGTGSAFLKVKFSNAKREWIFKHAGCRDACFYPESSPNSDWLKATGTVIVPAGATYMSILLYMRQRDGEYNRFDNILLYQIQPLVKHAEK